MPHSNSRPLCRGPILIDRLRRTVTKVKWFGSDGVEVGLIEVTMALAIVAAGVYEGKASHSRVYFIREVDTRPRPLNDPTFWNDRAVIKYDGAVRLRPGACV